MKARFNRQEVADALGAVCTVAAARTPKEVLRCVQLEAQADVLLLSATDLELSIRCAGTQVEVDQPGRAVVIADTLARIVQECPDEILEIHTKDNDLHIRGAGSYFQVRLHESDDFPAIPAPEGDPDLTTEFGALRRMVELTTFACARESTRYAINGVLWEVNDGRLTMVATDGRRLACCHGKAEVRRAEMSAHVIVPAKGLGLLTRISADPQSPASVWASENQLIVRAGRTTISTALVEGHFPRYQDVIPPDNDKTVELDAAEFRSALKRAALLTNEESKGVRLSFSKEGLILSSRAPEQGEATIHVRVDYRYEPLDIGFNPIFLLDVLRVIDTDLITFSVKEPNRPAIVRTGKDFLYVVMPVSLN